MAGITAFFAALLVTAQAVAAGGDSFPCDKLGEESVRIFEGIGPAAEPAAAAPVRLKKGALIARERYPLVARWLTFDDLALATDGGKFPAVAFRAFRIEGKPSFCTSTVRENVFGPRQDGTFLLRCLVDEDGDGRFESSRAHGELVSYNMRTGKTGRPTGTVPPLRPLSKPVALVENEAARDPSPLFAPRIVSELRVRAIGPETLTLVAATQVVMSPGPDGGRVEGGGDEQVMTLPLREGSWTSPSGRTILLARQGKDWHARLSGAAPAPVRLLCGGSVVTTGTLFSIMTEGGMSVVRGPDAPPR
jgi:hypothetical protein